LGTAVASLSAGKDSGAGEASCMVLPPPPPLPIRGSRASRYERLLAGGSAIAGLLVFTLAAMIWPYDHAGMPYSHGTHRQLGLPECSLRSTLGLPCPSCGLTTSVSLLVHGDPVAAWRANWVGVFLTSGGIAATAWLGLLAVGIPRPPRLSAQATLLAFAIGGAALVTVRQIGLMVSMMGCSPW